MRFLGYKTVVNERKTNAKYQETRSSGSHLTSIKKRTKSIITLTGQGNSMKKLIARKD